MTTSLRHLIWADDLLFSRLGLLPPEALSARLRADDQTVGELAMHIVSGAQWFRYCLTGYQYLELNAPKSPGDLAWLKTHLRQCDEALLAQVSAADELVTFEDEDGPRTVRTSMILAQASYHCTEHRTQIACTLDSAGIPGICLDDFDHWTFASAEGQE